MSSSSPGDPRSSPSRAKQIALLQTFADQAVIAIENVRLFTELEARNGDLTEALEQQTATGTILGVISSSPTDVQPVFDAIAQSATALCEATNTGVFRYIDGLIHLVAHHNWPAEALDAIRRVFPIAPGRGTSVARAILTRTVSHIADVTKDPEYSATPLVEAGFRTSLAVPMLRDGQPIGAISVSRMEPQPFSDKQVKLLETFANQAVIAIENVRLFKELEARNRELTESLEQQTATGEILRVIASSPTDLQPVLDVVAENAARVCGGIDSLIFRLEGNVLRLVARYGTLPVVTGIGDTISATRDSVAGRTVRVGARAVPFADRPGQCADPGAGAGDATRDHAHPTVDERVGDIVADERKVKQILVNLLSNAVKFTPEGGRVGLTATVADGVVTIAVSDTGVGIAPRRPGGDLRGVPPGRPRRRPKAGGHGTWADARQEVRGAARGADLGPEPRGPGVDVQLHAARSA